MTDKAPTLATILSKTRAPQTLIAWRGTQGFTLHAMRLSVAELTKQLLASPAKRWALYIEDSYNFAVALLATCYSGKIPILLGHLRPVLLAEQRAEFDAVLTDAQISLASCPVINITSLTKATDAVLPAWPEQQHLVLFTSGSTGKPKAIYKPIDLLELEGQLLIKELVANWSVDKLIATVSHQHLYGLTFRILLPLLAGIAFDAEMIRYHEQLQPYSADGALLVASPAFLKRLDPHLSTMQFSAILSSGGALSYEEAQLTQECLGVLPEEIYGTSETGVIATRQQQYPEQCWQAFTGVKLVARTDETLVNTLLCHPSDIVITDKIRLLTEGFLLLGRQDKIVKIEEKRISLTEVEQRIIALADVAEAVVVILEKGHVTSLGAVLVLSTQGELTLAQVGKHLMFQQVRQYLKTYLEAVAIPKKWRIVNSLPRNTQGKLIYSDLQELFR